MTVRVDCAHARSYSKFERLEPGDRNAGFPAGRLGDFPVSRQ